MVEIFESIVTNVLTSIYQPFWFALILAVLFMFVYKQYNNIRSAIIQWIKWFFQQNVLKTLHYSLPSLSFYFGHTVRR